VGRNLMKHNCTAMVQLNTKPNPAVFQKTIAVSDFYWGEADFPYPMGFVQNTGNVLADMLPASAPGLLAPLLKLRPGAELKTIANHSVGWWLQTEDLPDPLTTAKPQLGGSIVGRAFSSKSIKLNTCCRFGYTRVIECNCNRSGISAAPVGLAKTQRHQC
jgi:hypothetical protein